MYHEPKRSFPVLLLAVVLLTQWPVELHGFNVVDTTIAEIHAAFANASLNCTQLVQLHLNRIRAYDQAGPRLNSMIYVNPRLEAEARALDALPPAQRRAMHCIPVVVKDNINVAGMPTSAGCITLKDEMPNGDAFVVARLRAEGAIFMGKANMAEFAMDGGNTNSSLGGQTLNPYALDRSPMGSSGGPGAAIAASFGVIGLGTDTQGSIADPSNVESLVGLRSTQDLLPLDGVMPLYVYQDVVGPMCRSAEDLARVMEVIDAGRTRLRVRTAYTRYLQADALRGKRIGLLQGSAPSWPAKLAADPEVQAALQQLAANLRALGAVVVPLPLQYLEDTLYAMANAQSAASCGQVGQKNGFNVYFARETASDAPVRSLASLVQQYAANPLHNPAVLATLEGSLQAAYNCSIFDPGCELFAESRRIQARLNSRVLTDERLDMLAYATMSQLSPLLHGAPTPAVDLIQSFLSSTAGQPSITLPVAYSRGGVPIGVTLLAEAYHEPQLVQAVYAYQQRFNVRRAPSSCPPLQ